ncbi:MAG: hypothetical protein ACO222_05840 [Polynucleobacter sp.]
MQPINYLPQQQPDIGARFLSGLQAGAALGQLQQQQQAREQAQKMQEQYAIDLQSTMKNPTAQAFGELALKYPGQREAILASGKYVTEAQQNTLFSDAAKIYNALNTGNADAALAYATQKRDALKNAGKDFSDYEEVISSINNSPDAAKATIGIIGASLDPKKWLEIHKAPSEIAEAGSRAATAATKAKFAESEAVLDLQKKGWDITKLQEDIKIAKENSRIAAINAQISRENNALKRQELGMKAQEMIDKRDEAIREKVASAQSSFADMDNFLNTADKILSTPKDVIKSATGPISAKLPTVSQSTADLEALVETLGSQAFMSQIPKMKGLGALTETEGKKLQSSLQNLSLTQSPEQFTANVKEAQRLILKARKNLADRTGIPQGVPDTPAAQPASSEIDALLKKYGGQ